MINTYRRRTGERYENGTKHAIRVTLVVFGFELLEGNTAPCVPRARKSVVDLDGRVLFDIRVNGVFRIGVYFRFSGGYNDGRIGAGLYFPSVSRVRSNTGHVALIFYRSINTKTRRLFF